MHSGLQRDESEEMSLARNRPRYAARLNAFKATIDGRPNLENLVGVASDVEGLDAADLNYPDHFDGYDDTAITSILNDAGMALNGVAVRYYSYPEFRLGAFTNPDPAVRRAALDVTKRAIDRTAELGGDLMTLWMGQDGFDYSFQLDYNRAWDDTVDGFREVAAHNPNVNISVEYKPSEPRAFALLPDVGSTLLAVKETGADNIGVTIDFAHVLVADEMPAHAASMIGRHSRLLGVHLNDGYGNRDDGVMVGAAHPVQTVELFVVLEQLGYDGVIYFDTFPDDGGLDPREECRTNILAAERLRRIAEGLAGDPALMAAIQFQDAAISHRMIMERLYGDGR